MDLKTEVTKNLVFKGFFLWDKMNQYKFDLAKTFAKRALLAIAS